MKYERCHLLYNSYTFVHMDLNIVHIVCSREKITTATKKVFEEQKPYVSHCIREKNKKNIIKVYNLIPETPCQTNNRYNSMWNDCKGSYTIKYFRKQNKKKILSIVEEKNCFFSVSYVVKLDLELKLNKERLFFVSNSQIMHYKYEDSLEHVL